MLVMGAVVGEEGVYRNSAFYSICCGPKTALKITFFLIKQRKENYVRQI